MLMVVVVMFTLAWFPFHMYSVLTIQPLFLGDKDVDGSGGDVHPSLVSIPYVQCSNQHFPSN